MLSIFSTNFCFLVELFLNIFKQSRFYIYKKKEISGLSVDVTRKKVATFCVLFKLTDQVISDIIRVVVGRIRFF